MVRFWCPQFIKYKILERTGGRVKLDGLVDLVDSIALQYYEKNCSLDMLSKSPACILLFTSILLNASASLDPIHVCVISLIFFWLFSLFFFDCYSDCVYHHFVYLDHFLFLCSFYTLFYKMKIDYFFFFDVL